MTLHDSTFEYLKPSDKQIAEMAVLREASKQHATLLDRILPDGPDKTYILRKFRELCMWNNVALTRLPDGTPRE